MGFRERFLTQHARAHATEVGRPDLSVQDIALRDVMGEQMRLRPRPGFNSLAWLLWHMTRGEDVGMNVIIAESPQVLDASDWLPRMNILRRDVGTGTSAGVSPIRTPAS